MSKQDHITNKPSQRSDAPLLAGLKVLAVDDDAEVRDLIAGSLRANGATVVEAADGLEGYDRFLAEPFDLIVSDMRMPLCTGTDMLDRIRRSGRPVPGFIIVTGFDDVNTAELRNLGGFEVLLKPLESSDLLRSIQAYLRLTKRHKKG